MNLALILDKLMTHPYYREIAAELQAIVPPGSVDQAGAATRDAAALAEAPATAAGFPGASTCRHSPDPNAPQPVFAAAWKPGLITCAGCVHLLSLRKGSAADSTCDACGHQCAGPEEGDGIYAAMVQVGPLVFQYGVCGG